jgi:rhodanese-related sulfurtransferase
MPDDQTLDLMVDELHAMMRAASDVAIVDVREPWEVEICSISGSIAVPLATLPQHVDAVPRDRPVVVVCHHGVRSRHATQWLRAQGIANAQNLQGGIDAWARQVDPSMRVY